MICMECAKDSSITSISKGHAPNQLASEVEEATNKIIIHGSEDIGQDPIGGSEPKEDAVELVIDPLAERHPCYFHMRVSGEADYFMISSLKDKVKEQFRISFTDCSERDLFAEVVKKLYSERANYQELKTLAIDVVVNNLPSLRKGFSPAIDSELLESVPSFAVDLCLATMDEYVSEPPNMKPYPFATGFGTKYRPDVRRQKEFHKGLKSDSNASESNFVSLTSIYIEALLPVVSD